MKLIKVGNHYVPEEYRIWSNTKEERPPAYYEDADAALPSIHWDQELNKYVVEFSGPDSGGYDVMMFTWYYDSIQDYLKDLGIESL